MESLKPRVRSLLSLFLGVFLAVGLARQALATEGKPAFKITSTSPAHNASRVGLLDPIKITFNAPIDQNTVQLTGVNQNILLDPATGSGGQVIAFSATYENNGQTLVLNHSVPFAEGQLYTVRVLASIRTTDSANFAQPNEVDDQGRSALGSNDTFSRTDVPNPFIFTTVDTRPPFIQNHVPAHNATDVSITAEVTITFSEPMDPPSVLSQTTISPPDENAVLSLSPDGVILTISRKKDANGNPIPWKTASIQGGGTVTISVGGTDLSGNPLRDNPAGVNDSNRNPFSFKTVDSVGPSVVSTTPVGGATGIAKDAPIIIKFDEPVNLDVVKTQSQVAGAQATFVLHKKADDPLANLLPGVVTISPSTGTSDTVTIFHEASFEGDTEYEVVIFQGADRPGTAFRDAKGNLIAAEKRFSFRTRETIPPTIIAVSPVPGFGWPENQRDQANLNPDGFDPALDNNARFVPTDPIVVTFSEPIDPASFTFDLREKGAADQVGGLSVTWSNNNTVATIQHAPLKAGDKSVYRFEVKSAKDTSGNDLVPGAIPNNVMHFVTRDLTGPALTTTSPANGAAVDPDDTQPDAGLQNTLILNFSEPLKADELPLISLKYTSGAVGPAVDPNDATTLSGPGASTTVVQVKATALSNNNQTITLRLLNTVRKDGKPVDANNPANAALAPGDVLVVQVVTAKDRFGNALRPDAAPNPYAVAVNDTRPPVLNDIVIGGRSVLQMTANDNVNFTDVVNLKAPIVVRFSKTMSNADTDRLVFDATAGDDFSSSADAIAGAPAGFQRWRAKASAYSSDLRTVTLTHADFPESPAAGQFNLHQFQFISATDRQSQAVGSFADPKLNTLLSYRTERRPRIVKFEVQLPKTAGDLDGGKLIDNNDVNRFDWKDLPPALNAVVPLNSKLRVTFDHRMDPTSVGVPTMVPSVGGWSVSFTTVGAINPNAPDAEKPNTVAIYTHSQDFIGPNQSYGRAGGQIQPTVPVYTNLLIQSGLDFKGDPLVPPAAQGFSTIDATPPSIAGIEYLANVKDDGTTDGDPQWKPLAGATNVPTNTRFRVRINETLGPGGAQADNVPASVTIVRDGDTGNDIAGANPTAGAREDANNITGSQATITLGTDIKTLLQLSGDGTAGFDPNKPINPFDGSLNQVPVQFKVQVKVQDTRVRQLSGDAGPSPTPNETVQSLSFTLEDETPPIVVDIKPKPTDPANPTDPIIITFSEPVDLASVDLENLGDDSGDVTGLQKTISADGKTVTFTHDPFPKPTSGSAFTFKLRVKAGVKDRAVKAGNEGPNVQNNLALLNDINSNPAARAATDFVINVPAEVTPPTVVSVISTRDTTVVEYSEPVVSTTDPGNVDANTGFGVSAANPANYVAPLKFDPGSGNLVDRTSEEKVASKGKISHVFFNRNRFRGFRPDGTEIRDVGFDVEDIPIQSIEYNAATRTATLILGQPMTKGQEETDPDKRDKVVFEVSDVKDLATNPIAANTRREALVQTGRRDWRIKLSVTADVPGASVDVNNFIGVDANAKNDRDDLDIPEPLAPGANHVFLASVRSDAEFGAGQGGSFTQDVMARPAQGEERSWPNIAITTDLGVDQAPATITLTWDLAVPGREVPFSYAVELKDPDDINGDGIKSYDMRKMSSFSFKVAANGVDTTKRLSIRVATPKLVSKTFSPGFNLISIPVQPQNPDPASVLFGLVPQVTYRFTPGRGYEIWPINPEFSKMEVNRAYWIQPRANTTLNVLGAPNVGTQVISLKEGWNGIAASFDANVSVPGNSLLFRSGDTVLSVAQAIAQGWIQPTLFRYDNASRTYVAVRLDQASLDPWVGYWILAFRDVDLLIPAP